MILDFTEKKRRMHLHEADLHRSWSRESGDSGEFGLERGHMLEDPSSHEAAAAGGGSAVRTRSRTGTEAEAAPAPRPRDGSAPADGRRDGAPGALSITPNRWKLGLISALLNPADIMVEVYRALGAVGFLWKTLSPYEIKCRYDLGAVSAVGRPRRTTGAYTYAGSLLSTPAVSDPCC